MDRDPSHGQPDAPARGFLGSTLAAAFARLPVLLVLGGLAATPHALHLWWNGATRPDLVAFLALGAPRLIGTALVIAVVLHDLAGTPCSLSHMCARAFRRLPAMLVAWAATLACVWMLFRLGVLAAGGLGPLAPLVLVTTFVVCMGLVSALRLSVAVAFLESRSGTGSMARSAALTRGRRLRIVLAELVLGILLSPLSGLLRGLEPGTTRYLIAEIGTQAVILTVHACFAAVVYAQLRQRRDGATAAVVVASLGR